jgi:putative FmdB family regulatory protein
MPIFEYRCAACGETSEFIEGVIEQAQAVHCPRCGSPEMTRLLSRGVGAAKKENAGGGDLLRQTATVRSASLWRGGPVRPVSKAIRRDESPGGFKGGVE